MPTVIAFEKIGSNTVRGRFKQVLNLGENKINYGDICLTVTLGPGTTEKEMRLILKPAESNGKLDRVWLPSRNLNLSQLGYEDVPINLHLGKSYDILIISSNIPGYKLVIQCQHLVKTKRRKAVTTTK